MTVPKKGFVAFEQGHTPRIGSSYASQYLKAVDQPGKGRAGVGIDFISPPGIVGGCFLMDLIKYLGAPARIGRPLSLQAVRPQP